jgi:hypothetical protein
MQQYWGTVLARERGTSRYVNPTEQLVVEIFVRDITRSIAFYRQLGFELLDHRESLLKKM